MEVQKLIYEWAEATGNTLHYGETLRGVSVDDLVKLALAVERDTRERCAKMAEGEPIMDGKNRARKGPGNVGTWHESSPMHYAMQELARCIRAA